MASNCVFRSTRLPYSSFVKVLGPCCKPKPVTYHTNGGNYASETDETKSEPEKPRYFQGKKIVEEEIDPYTHKNLLLSITGYDAAILDSYSKFVQTAAQMTDVNLTKSFNMPAATEKINVRKSDSQLRKDQMQYVLKRHKRVVEISDVKEDKIDIFLNYINDKLPSGMKIDLELKRWEELVEPDHPSLKKFDKTLSRYQKS